MEAAHCLLHATDTEPPHTVSALTSTCLSATVDPHSITPSLAYKCLARAVKVAEGRYKSQEPFVPSPPPPPHLSLLHPIAPPPPPFLRSSDLQPTTLPLVSSKMSCMRNT